MLINIPRPITIFPMQQLSNVDYNIATKVSEDVASTVTWSYNHNLPILAEFSINLLQTFDNFGSLLIGIVVWIVHNTK